MYHTKSIRRMKWTKQPSEEDLNAPHRFAWTEPWPGYSLIAVIADNSYEHYHGHARQIHRLLDQMA